jgi:PAS domain S-box-containing protein
MNAVVRVFVAEQREDGYEATARLLESQSRTPFEVDWRGSYDEARETIRERRHDAYLIDYRWGERTGLDLLNEASGPRDWPPALMLVAGDESDPALEQAGLELADVVVKEETSPVSLERAIHYAIARNRAIRDLVARADRYALAAEAVDDAVWDRNLDTERIYLSSEWHALLGRSEPAGERDPSDWFELVHPDDQLRLRVAIDAHVFGLAPRVDCAHRLLSSDGEWRWVLSRGSAIHDDKGTARRLTGWLSDITDRRAAEMRVTDDALHDALTGLPNRPLFLDRLDYAERRARRDPETRVALLVLDIDHFKLVNEGHGQAVGDQLLQPGRLRHRGQPRTPAAVSPAGAA